MQVIQKNLRKFFALTLIVLFMLSQVLSVVVITQVIADTAGSNGNEYVDDDDDGYSENQGDCNDFDNTTYPGAIEICGDNVDQNCDNQDLACFPGPDNLDVDNDGFDDSVDNCPQVYNPEQENLDSDLQGDVCDSDIDGDGVENIMDMCPETTLGSAVNPDGCSSDIDSDGIIDSRDNCPASSNPNQMDTDVDGIGDACDAVAGENPDLYIGSVNIKNSSFEINACSSQTFSGNFQISVQINGVNQVINSSNLEANVCKAISSENFSYFNLEANEYYNLAATIDPFNEIQESNENNNVFNQNGSIPNMIGADLYIKEIGMDSVNSGSLYVDICNAGGVVSDVEVEINVNAHTQTISYGSALGTTCKRIYSWDVSYFEVEMGKTYLVNTLIDPNNKIQETNENNNSFSDSLVIIADSDNDGIADTIDNCPLAYNPTQIDSDNDAAGNACDGTNGNNYIDDDGDGYSENQGDCDDYLVTVNPVMTEIPYDGLDNDCNVNTQDNPDSDGDGVAVTTDCDDNNPNIGAATDGTCDADSDGYVDITAGGDDCNDEYATINPGESEIPYDGLDNDCNSTTTDNPVDNDHDGHNESDDCNDNDPTVWATESYYEDFDADGFGGEAVTLCYIPNAVPEDYVTNGTDNCPAIHNPNQADSDADGIGDACDSNSVDDDHDSYTEDQGDCDDNQATVNPGMTEIPYDGIDNDCNVYTLDEPIVNGTEYTDDDDDGYSENQGDCNDNLSTTYPGAKEICGDNIDQNCDYQDLACPVTDPNDVDDDHDGYSENQGDCDDSNSTVSPGRIEIPYDGKDNDCKTSTKDDDLDGDGYTHDVDCNDTDPVYNPTNPCLHVDADGDGYFSVESGGTDCDDTNSNIHPNATEIPNDNVDQNCNGEDGLSPEDTQDVPNGGSNMDDDYDGFTEMEGDCNDINPNIYPNAVETCGDNIDQNCNDEDLLCADNYYIDDDGDGYSENQGDCNDASVNVWRNGTFYVDQDADTYGAGTPITLCYGSSTPAGYSTNNLDCNDSNASLNTGANACISGNNDGDNDGYISSVDCNDNNATVWQTGTFYVDQDADTYGAGTPITLCYGSSTPVGYSTNNLDCNDSNASLNTGTNICTNGGGTTDADSDGHLSNVDCNDNNATVWQTGTFYVDQDADTYGAGTPITLCYGSSTPAGYSTNNLDCNDSNASLNTGDKACSTVSASLFLTPGGAIAMSLQDYLKKNNIEMTIAKNKAKVKTAQVNGKITNLDAKVRYDATRDLRFTDLEATDTIYPYVDVLKKMYNSQFQYALSGMSNKDDVANPAKIARFAPNTPMTRLSATKIAIVLSGNEIKDNVSRNVIFYDVPRSKDEDSEWVRAIMNTAYSLGIINKNSGYARPNSQITRVEALAIFTRAGDLFDDGTYKVDKFNDIDDNAWYKNLIGYMENKIDLSGEKIRRFFPNEIVTRSEGVKLAVRVAKVIPWIMENVDLATPLQAVN